MSPPSDKAGAAPASVGAATGARRVEFAEPHAALAAPVEGEVTRVRKLAGVWRWLLVGGGAVAWLGSALVFRQPLFGPVILLACLSYLSPEEWRGVRDFIVSVLPWTGSHAVAAKTSSPAPRVSKPSRV